MTTGMDSTHFSAQARELREVFDAAFSAPLPPPPPDAVPLLLVRAGGECLAVKRTEMSGLVGVETLARVPGPSTTFLGLAGMHGALYPVWSLTGLLGRPFSATTNGWLLLTKAVGGSTCAFFCEALENIAFVAEADLTATPQGSGAIQAIAPGPDGPLSVVSLPALRELIIQRKPNNPSLRNLS